MKAYKVTLLIIDHDGVGPGIKAEIENARYPNDCLSPHVKTIDVVDIGDWYDAHPLNDSRTADQEYERLFPNDGPGTPAARLAALLAKLEYRFPDPESHRSDEVPEARALRAVDDLQRWAAMGKAAMALRDQEVALSGRLRERAEKAEERLWAARENLKRAVGVLQEVKRSGLPDESIDPRFHLGSQVWVVCDDIEKSLKDNDAPDLYTLTECESAASMARDRNEQVSDMLKEIRARRKK